MPKGTQQISLPPFSVDLQIRFWMRLQHIRNQFLYEALSQTVEKMDIAELDRELAAVVDRAGLAALAAYSLRGETVFAAPCVLRAKPMLLGYYRLLYGISQKEFYRTPYGRFKPMEESNRTTRTTEQLLPALCASLNETTWKLLKGIEPVSLSVLHDLQLLTVGPQLRGSQNNRIGQEAIAKVFNLMLRLLNPHVQSSTPTVMAIKNASGRTVQIAFAPDPDITIIEQLPSKPIPSVAIEVKGGTDASNVHNRIGEAEKSHQKAKAEGFTQFWTILRAQVNEDVARNESPTTSAFFQLNDIVNMQSPSHAAFRDHLFHTVGIA